MRSEVVIWHWASTGDGFPEYDLYGRMLDADGVPASSAFVIQETDGNQQNPTVAYGGDSHFQLAWQDDREGDWDLYTAFLDPDYQYVTIQYEYDPLYRLTNADYSGDFNSEYTYAYDGVGNRLVYTTSITSTTVVTYQYDLANRLTESVADGITTTTYTWDNMSRLITTTVGAQVSRVYQFSQDGDLTRAIVDGLTTTFSYDGMGNRLLMSVAGEVTTYTLDYAGNSGRVLFEEGSENKHYLYGYACLGEIIDTGTANEEIRYYHRDGSSMVRQTSNADANIALAWTFTPEGMVLLGEEGPVTHLDCGADAVYEWSTGLIFKNGRYFDPTIGIWLAIAPLIIWQARKPNKRKRRRRCSKRISWLLLLLLIAVIMVGCNNGGGLPNPCESSTPMPGTRPSNIVVLGGSWGDPERINERGPEPNVQIPHFAAVATAPAIQYPGSILDPETLEVLEGGKQRQANEVGDYDGDLLII